MALGRPKKNGDRIVIAIGYGYIEHAVAVEVPSNDRIRRVANREVGPSKNVTLSTGCDAKN